VKPLLSRQRQREVNSTRRAGSRIQNELAMPFGAPWRMQPGLTMIQDNSNWEQRVIKEELVVGCHDPTGGNDSRQQVLPGGVPEVNARSPPKRSSETPLSEVAASDLGSARRPGSPATSDISCAPGRLAPPPATRGGPTDSPSAPAQHNAAR
jgi:hypothetical protein